jgi:hypothetical protein
LLIHQLRRQDCPTISANYAKYDEQLRAKPAEFTRQTVRNNGKKAKHVKPNQVKFNPADAQFDKDIITHDSVADCRRKLLGHHNMVISENLEPNDTVVIVGGSYLREATFPNTVHLNPWYD